MKNTNVTYGRLSKQRKLFIWAGTTDVGMSSFFELCVFGIDKE